MPGTLQGDILPRDISSKLRRSCVRFPVDVLQKCWFLAGPTASGKSAVGVWLAQRIGAEIISLDSMTIYRGMDIGTAKPTVAEQSEVRHHLLDVREPHEEFSTAEFLAASLTACEEILSRGRVPLFVGGTGLYLRSVLRGVFEGPSADWELRKAWERVAAEQGAAALHAQLAKVDPPTAQRLHVNDQRRIIRALEIHALTGRAASEQQQEAPLPPDLRPRHLYWLNPDRERLRHRIDVRIDAMITAGLVREVDELLQTPHGLGPTARQALGYREVLAHLEDGVPLDDAIAQLKIHTHQFAKRQWTWFRNLEELTPIDIRGDEAPGEIGERILSLSRGSDQTRRST